MLHIYAMCFFYYFRSRGSPSGWEKKARELAFLLGKRSTRVLPSPQYILKDLTPPHSDFGLKVFGIEIRNDFNKLLRRKYGHGFSPLGGGACAEISIGTPLH